MTRYLPQGSDRSQNGTVRIIQVSDLHGKQFGASGAVLLNRIRALRPDIIAITGDFLDHRRSAAAALIANIVDLRSLAPLFLVTGNHEYWSSEWGTLRAAASAKGATILENRLAAVTCSQGRSLTIAGVEDFLFFGRSIERYRTALRRLAESAAQLSRPVVLLAHRPEHFKLYAEAGFDLVLSGHAHGGQVRIPGIGPVYAPNEGIFPKYAEGMHRLNGSYMVVSRGLGPSRVPIRIFNPPELVVVDLPV